ncbi:MAG TPA: zinc ribbon domain-containing protein [Ktedonobacteraceae bacterium]
MVFCGKCGFQLTSGNITCPRCGTPIETELISGESQPDSPTIAASTIFSVNQSYAGTQETISPSRPVEQQPLILGSNPNEYGNAEQMANEATNRMGSQNAGTGQIPNRAVYSDYMPQSAANYPQQRASYAGYAVQGGTTSQPYGTSPEDAERVRARGRIAGLLLILIGLLFILGAMVLFILTHNTSTSAPSSIQQAHTAFALLCLPTCF